MCALLCGLRMLSAAAPYWQEQVQRLLALLAVDRHTQQHRGALI